VNLNSWIAIAFSAKINIPIWLCIVPPPKAGEQYERTAILYHQQYTSKLGEINLKYDYPFSTPLQNTFINEEKLS